MIFKIIVLKDNSRLVNWKSEIGKGGSQLDKRYEEKVIVYDEVDAFYAFLEYSKILINEGYISEMISTINNKILEKCKSDYSVESLEGKLFIYTLHENKLIYITWEDFMSIVKGFSNVSNSLWLKKLVTAKSLMNNRRDKRYVALDINYDFFTDIFINNDLAYYDGDIDDFGLEREKICNLELTNFLISVIGDKNSELRNQVTDKG